MLLATMRSSLMFLFSRQKENVLKGMLVLFVVFIGLEVRWARRDFLKKSVCYINEGPSPKQWQNWSCIDRTASLYNRVEDIFCILLPKFRSNLKNPCFYDFGNKNHQVLRCLPYFYIIGMDKSGSTDLHSRIVKHPYVMDNKGYLGKETGFWSWLRYGIFNKRDGMKRLTLDEYMDMFAQTARILEESNITQIITGDATPMDMWDFRSWPLIPQNQGREEPVVLTPHFLKYIYREQQLKFFIQLREPVERLYSDYIFLNYGKNPEEFHNHSLQAIEMMQECLENYSRRICYFSDKLYQDLPARIHLGCYSVFLQEWFNVFPRSIFHITTVDDYEDNMTSVLTSAFKFLDLPTLPDVKMAEIVNQTRRRVTKNKSGVILPDTVKILREFYDDCNKETAELLKDERFLWLKHYS